MGIRRKGKMTLFLLLEAALGLGDSSHPALFVRPRNFLASAKFYIV
jgi:hypothetical protein